MRSVGYYNIKPSDLAGDIALGESWNCVKTATDQVNATPADPAAHKPTEKGEVVFDVTPPKLFTAVSYIFSVSGCMLIRS